MASQPYWVNNVQSLQAGAFAICTVTVCLPAVDDGQPDQREGRGSMTLYALFQILRIQGPLFVSLPGRDGLVRQSPRNSHLDIGQRHCGDLGAQRRKYTPVTAKLRLCLRIDHAERLTIDRSNLTENRSRPEPQIGPITVPHAKGWLFSRPCILERCPSADNLTSIVTCRGSIEATKGKGSHVALPSNLHPGNDLHHMRLGDLPAPAACRSLGRVIPKNSVGQNHKGTRLHLRHGIDGRLPTHRWWAVVDLLDLPRSESDRELTRSTRPLAPAPNRVAH